MGGLTRSSSTTSAEPWGPAGNLYKSIYKGIGNAMTQGPQVYQGSTVTPFSNQTMDAFKGLTKLTDKNTGGNGMSDNLQQILNNGGFTNGQQKTIGDMRDLLNNSGLNALANGNGFTQGQQNTINNLRQDTNHASNMLDTIMSGNGLNSSQDAALKSAQDLLNNKSFADIMNGNGLSAMQQGAYDQMANSIGKSDPMMQALADAGGLTPEQRAQLNSMTGEVNSNNAAYQSLFNNGGMTADARAAMDRYNQIASTPFDINSNPAYAAVRANTLAAQQQALNGQAAASGRYAGAANQSILAREQGKTASNMDYNQFLNDQSQKNMANQAIMQGAQAAIGNMQNLGQAQLAGRNSVANLSQTGVQNQGNALDRISNNNNNLFNAAGTGIQQQMAVGNQLAGLQNNVFGMGQQGTTNKMNAANQQQQMNTNLLNAQQMGVDNRNNAVNQLSGLAGNLFNAQNAGLGNMGTAYQTALQPYQTQQMVGAQLEDKQNQLKQDELRKFDASNPLNYYGGILGMLNGTPQSQTTTQTPSTMSNLLSLTGLGLGGLGLYNQFFPSTTGGGMVPAGG